MNYLTSNLKRAFGMALALIAAPLPLIGATSVCPLVIDSTAQQAYVKASNTGPNDFFGASIAISGNTMVVGAWSEDSGSFGVNGDESDEGAENSGAVYVFIRTAGGWSQQAYLKASNAGAFDEFGRTVALSGHVLVVGAPKEDSAASGVNGDQLSDGAMDSGAAYVFIRNGSSWSQQAYLKASNPDVGDGFGNSVAVFADTVVVGAHGEDSSATGVDADQSDGSARDSGAAYVFVREDRDWIQQAYLKASNTDTTEELIATFGFANGDEFGTSVAVAENIVAIGAPFEDGVDDEQGNSLINSGAAYVFVRKGQSWSQQAYLKATNNDERDEFGFSLAISGDTLVVGAYAEDSVAVGENGDQTDNSETDSGAVYVYLQQGEVWRQQSYLKPTDPTPQNPSFALSFKGDYFGWSVAISGDTLIAGAPSEDRLATGVNNGQSIQFSIASGAAYMFTRKGKKWSEQAYMKASNTNMIDMLGTSVAVSGSTLAVGANLEDSKATGVNGDLGNDDAGRDSGAAYVFKTCPAELASSELTLLGEPPNPDAFRPGQTSGPVIGALWDPYVDHSAFMPHAVVDIFALQSLDSVAIAASLQAPIGGDARTGFTLPKPGAPATAKSGMSALGLVGTLICDPEEFRITSMAPAGRPFAIAMPNDCSLVGTNWCAQALSIGPSGVGHLTNALQITIGSF